MDRLQAELDRHNQDAEDFGQFERRADGLAKELRALQGQLADYNMLVDKMHTDTDIGDIVRQTQKLKDKNDLERRRVDALFSERTAKEELKRNIEGEIDAVREAIDTDLKRLAPEVLRQFREAQGENEGLTDAIERFQAELDDASYRIASMEDAVRADPLKARAFHLYTSMQELSQRRRDMVAEAEDAATAGPDEKKRLLARVKADTAETGAMARRVEQLEEDLIRLRERSADFNRDADAQQSERYAKYVAILDKEQQMDGYIAEFPALEAQLRENVREREKAIAAALQASARALARSGALPATAHVADLEDRLVFQEDQMGAAEVTQQRLLAEREARAADLKKLQQLDKKIDRDIETLRARIPEMEAELVTFSNTEKVKADAKRLEQRLTVERQRLTQQRQVMKGRVQRLEEQLRAQSEAVDGAETRVALAALEAKLAIYAQTNAELRDYIEAKGAETDYRARLGPLQTLLDGLNGMVMEAAKHRMPIS